MTKYFLEKGCMAKKDSCMLSLTLSLYNLQKFIESES